MNSAKLYLCRSLVNLLNTNTLPNLQHASLIDVSLTKLFQCMSIAYRQKLTSPKWNRFLGMKLRWKDKFRLNNVIWRCWHMQFIKGHRKLVCAFANPMELDNHNKTEAGAIMEGKYWKRKMNMILAEYKKWRIFYKNQHNWGPSDSVKHFPDLNTSVEGLKTGKDDIELETLITDHDFFVDALFNSLGSQSVHIQDTEKFLGSEFLQPSGPSLNLQPNIEELMDLDPLAPIQDWLSSKLPENMDVTLQNIKDIEVSAVSYHPFSHATLRDVEGYPGGKTGTGFSGGETGSEKASYHSQPSTSTFSSYNEYKRKPPLPGKKLWAIQQQQQELQQQQQQQQRQQQQLLADYNTPHVSVIQNSHSVYLTPEPAPVSLTPCQQTSVIKSLGPYQPTPSYLTPRDHLSQETVKQDKSSELVQLLQNKTPSRQTGAKHKKEEAEDLSHRGGKHKRIVSIPPPPATCQPQPSLSLDLSHSQDPITDPVKVSSAEHKRKHSIKTGFDFLRTQIPSLAGTPNLKISKAALLARGADHVDYLSKVNVSLGQEVEALRKSVQALNTEITNFQSELPTAGEWLSWLGNSSQPSQSPIKNGKVRRSRFISVHCI